MENRDLTREEREEKKEKLKKAKELSDLVGDYNHISGGIFSFIEANMGIINSGEFKNTLISYKKSLDIELEWFNRLFPDLNKEIELGEEKSNPHKK